MWRELPTKPGIYIFKNEKGKPIYVGKAKDLKKRVSSYFLKSDLESKTLRMLSDAKSLSHIVVSSEVEAFLLEANLIKKFKPLYNIRLSDDKFYPYLEINKKPIPYVIITRKKIEDKNKAYFGPYTSTTDLKIVLKILRRIFPYQSVKNHPNRRCLYYHLGLCPCIPIYPERLPQYLKDIKKLIYFFEGKKESVVKELVKDQKENIINEEFEKAGEIQKKIEKIEFITSQNYDPFAYEQKPDLYFERIKNELASLKQILAKYSIDTTLNRIECYDISNIQGTNATGSMVVFENGDVSKKEYKKFKIIFKKTPDDFAMHQEVMSRRLKHPEWGKPDLLVIDGGKGQVSSVLKVLLMNKNTTPVIGLAKKEETIVIPIQTVGYNFDFIEVKLPKSTPGVNLLRRIRDEAHRFAITYHKLLRKKQLNI